MGKKRQSIAKKSTRRKLRNSYFTSIISITLVLFLLGLIGILLLNARKISDYVKENIGVSVILNDNLKEIEVLRLQKSIDASYYAKSTNFISKDQAAKEFQEALGEDFTGFLGYNPLLASIEVKLHAEYSNPDSIQQIEKDLSSLPEVKEVYYQRNLISLVNENVRRISLYLLFFSVLLLTISIVLINNTVRLSVYSRRFLINTMQLIGANRSFIRKPFLISGIIQGIIGAAISIILLILLIQAMEGEFRGLVSISDYQFIAFLCIAIVVVAIFITYWAVFFAVNKFLRSKTNELYY